MLYNLFHGKPLPMARVSSNRAVNKVVLLVLSFFVYGKLCIVQELIVRSFIRVD